MCQSKVGQVRRISGERAATRHTERLASRSNAEWPNSQPTSTRPDGWYTLLPCQADTLYFINLHTYSSWYYISLSIFSCTLFGLLVRLRFTIQAQAPEVYIRGILVINDADCLNVKSFCLMNSLNHCSKEAKSKKDSHLNPCIVFCIKNGPTVSRINFPAPWFIWLSSSEWWFIKWNCATNSCSEWPNYY